jgi:phytoene desaturase
MREKAIKDKYDVVVIGSGIGGLTAAAVLSHAGRSVLIVEQHSKPGGYAHSFRRKKYLFDSAVHLITGCNPGGLVDELLSVLKIREQINFLRVDPFYKVIFPGTTVAAREGLEQFIDSHSRAFPAEAKSLREFLLLCQHVTWQLQSLYSTTSSAIVVDKLLPYRTATVYDVCSQYIQNPKLIAVLTGAWPYLGLPPHQLSYFYWCQMLISYIETGAYYASGSFQTLANVLVSAVLDGGGDIVLNKRVERIVIQNNNVHKVVLDDGNEVSGKIVISNIDAWKTFRDLIGLDKLPQAFVGKLKSLRPSVSAFVLYAATRCKIPIDYLSHETFYFRYWDFDEAFRNHWREKPSGLGITIPTLIDNSLAPSGENLVIATTLIPYDYSPANKEDKRAKAEAVADVVAEIIPGFKESLCFSESASPHTMERYTMNTTGSIYGWEASPKQVLNRLDNITPVNGLYLAGHWTKPGGGINAVIASGLQAVKNVMGAQDFNGMWGMELNC